MNYQMDKSFHSFREQVDGSARRALAGQAQRHKFKPLPPHKASYTSVMPVFLWRDGRWKQQTLCKPEASNASVCSNKRDPVSDKAECRDPHTSLSSDSTHACPHTLAHTKIKK